MPFSVAVPDKVGLPVAPMSPVTIGVFVKVTVPALRFTLIPALAHEGLAPVPTRHPPAFIPVPNAYMVDPAVVVVNEQPLVLQVTPCMSKMMALVA